ncbi:uncharacterized protein FIBRA_01034 [Fibroporia radiculosa]|uniref:Carbohydrate kinase PfkB domain-containing protein n=1 Tax=Fibroporia radiculosa TaxID=599839 RepID=J4GJ61_9APHY|nr:uncharacterized protein FIBRA_01034 [Fibroporia radiculosa]CCL99025.1 predicted protein [Fibroporia radiculosa]
MRRDTLTSTWCRSPRPFRGLKRNSSSLHQALRDRGVVDVHPEIAEALGTQQPVVALETTIVTHGMPYPVNLKTAKSVENIVRRTGAVPATIGIIGGRVKIGLEPHELEFLADVATNTAEKVSRRDIGPAIALGRHGGTTCSATLIFAALAGIKVFATGGLGGVHRGGETTMDVSADLHELTRCPVGLVSAGVKSILDIGRTLEYLETLGVPVVSYGKTKDFPAFYSRKSGFQSPWKVNDPITAARILYHQQQLGMANGVLFGVPIPVEYESTGEMLQEAVEQAVQEAEENGVSKMGKEATPWLLKRVGELTAGISLTSNVALIENTALIGKSPDEIRGQIAVALANLAQGNDSLPLVTSSSPSVDIQAPSVSTQPSHPSILPSADLVVFGSAAVDITAQASSATDSSIGVHSTMPGTVSLSLGGVARNVAEAAHRILSSRPTAELGTALLVSPIGRDSFGRLLVDETRRIGMRTDGFIQMDAARSAICNMVMDGHGGLTGGVADMGIVHTLEGNTALSALRGHHPRVVALDGNLSQETLKSLLNYCIDNKTTVFYEPTSVPKSIRIFPAIAAALPRLRSSDAPVSFAAPNLLELARMYEEARSGPLELTAHRHWWDIVDDMAIGSQFRMGLDQLARVNVDDQDSSKGTLSFLVEKGIAQMAIHLLPFFQHLIIKCGERGVIAAFRVSSEHGQSSPWLQEHSNVRGRYIVCRGKSSVGATVLKHFPALPIPKENIVNVTGAGDSLVGSILSSLLHTPTGFEDPVSLENVISHAQKAAVLTLQSQYAVSPLLSSLHEKPARR